ncbi:hypothetical protein FYJ24_11830 [Actinomycetaceae bacterium WB03_NA08]|uniref:Uncharacterized protein n=1 Tax=Scrofimicrobium canadense TaxID=2652290 RepID=A0A6N7VUF4_9ACTO|nr:hypothetical protein [Scrofimicrobium canadense]MSS85419.1 hypothetical protein [Scrofimicrobium canadense]
MGTIGDRLGADLQALFGGEGEASPDSADSPSDKADGPVDDATERTVDPAAAEADGESVLAQTSEEETRTASSPEETVFVTIAELSGIDRAALTAETGLVDIAVDGLALWAVVAELERSVGDRFLDEDVRQWQTVGEMVEAGQRAAR